jgi:hypothetical protein
VLVPLYVARRSMLGVFKAVRATPTGGYPALPTWVFAPDLDGLRSDRDQGFLAIGKAAGPRGALHRTIGGFRVQVRERLYSPYQLLDLPSASEVLADLRTTPRRRDRWARARLRHDRNGVDARRDLVVALSALETHYYPRLVQSVSAPLPGGIDAWDAADRHFDAVELQLWLGWSPDEIQAAAEDLSIRARQRDPMNGWTDLVAMVAPGRWKELRGDALLAVELRLAGEMLLRFHEDLQVRRAAPALPAIPRLAPHPLNWRMRLDASRLDEILTSFGLSPHPAVVLVVEGQTEMGIVPLVMDELGIPRRDTHIRLINARSETRDHRLLVSYAALPKLGPVERDYAEFIRPPTRYFIAVDGDRAFRTQAARDLERQKWVAAIAEDLPPEVKTPMGLAEIDSLVLLEAWADGLDFERAHFSDPELAQALLATGCAPSGVTHQHLEQSLAQQRAATLNGQPASLEDIWKRWLRKPIKPDLALAMWPMLRAKLRRKRSRRGLDQIPVARVLLRAHELAATTPRRNVVFRVVDRATASFAATPPP